MLTHTIAAHNKHPEAYTQSDVMSDAHMIVFAGSDTTAIALRSIFYHLLKYPETYSHLQNEIDQADAEGRLSPSITFTESNQLPYLIAVTKEAMRIYPSVALSVPRNTPATGATICGEYFPSGVTVGCNPYIVHRDHKIFGEDADQFRPERWLDERRIQEMEKALFTFGHGSRMCIGKNVSLMEIQKLVPQVLRHFKIRLTYPREEWKTRNRWFIKQEGLIVDLFLRKMIPSSDSDI